ncbi:lamin tail-like protein [Barrientosiimonas humi]|uniref:Lamin tail-like protein n=2 Tax=Barrientosiimonas TaxID=1535207 RepID=A0A542XEF7_9MICO|nr:MULTISPECIES: lamin tail domain-containing protein [Barrientosiimonas]TQL34205.1 lamin tail-like protein [Barrientosiimonas humi]BDZ59193.1 hypothetical protein GCM10025872_28500 [Barrientosiimonas endolithica]CAG7574197.1 hypothetical protein BH39T_PBIAJDOK_02840 [Barrientosiimonas humi]
MRRFVAALAAACALTVSVSANSTAEAALPPVKFGTFVADPAGADLPISTTKLNAEFIRLTNTTTRSIVMTGYTVRDNGDAHIYRFPSGYTIGSKRTVTLHTGTGRNTSTDLYWGRTSQYVWNNTGDTARLLSPTGRLVHSCTYTQVASGTKYC